MKAMILAVEVIEMVQGVPQGLTRRLPAKVIREDRLIALGIAAPFTLSPDNLSLVPASYAKCGKAPEAEGDRASEEDMVAHADDSDGHDHEQAAKPHRSREEAGLPPVELPAEEALGEESQKKGCSAYDADFGEHIEIHVVRMEDEDLLILNEEVGVGIGQIIAPPPHAEKRVLFDHGDGALPQGKSQADRGVFAGEEGQETLDHLSVVEEENKRDEEEKKTESLVIEEGEP